MVLVRMGIFSTMVTVLSACADGARVRTRDKRALVQATDTAGQDPEKPERAAGPAPVGLCDPPQPRARDLYVSQAAAA